MPPQKGAHGISSKNSGSLGKARILTLASLREEKGGPFPRRQIEGEMKDERKKPLPPVEEPSDPGDPDSSEGQPLRDGQVSIGALIVDPNKSYFFQLSYSGSITADGSGVNKGNYSWDPSSIDEFTYLSGLFGQVRIVEAQLQLFNWNTNDDTGLKNQGPFAVACDVSKTGITPSTVASVIDCPNSTFHQTTALVPTILRQKVRNREFALCSNPAPGPYAGCYGEWMWYGAGFTASKLYCQYLARGLYEFIGRT